jgi:signal transduction histidine kinase
MSHSAVNRQRLHQWIGGIAILLSFGAISIIAYTTYDQKPVLYHLSRSLYILPIIGAGYFFDYAVTLLVSLFITSLFIPSLVDLAYTTGVSHPTVELFTDLLTYNLVGVLTVGLVEFSRRQRKLLQAMERLGEAIGMSPDLGKVLSVFLKLSIWLCDADGGDIVLAEENSAALASLSVTSRSAPNQEMERSGSAHPNLLDWLTQCQELAILHDLGSDPRFDLNPDQARLQLTLLASPLRRDHERVGTLVLWNYGDRRFGRTEIDLLRVLIDKGEMVIENAWLYSRTDEALAKRTRELSMLLDASNAFSAARDLDELVQVICQKMTQLVESTFGRVFLLEQDAVSLTLRAFSTIRDPTWHADVDRTFAIDSLPWHHKALVENRPILLMGDNPETPLQEPERSILFGQGSRSALLVPLVGMDHSLGVVTLCEMRSWERSPFSAEKIEFCRALAREATLAIENIRAFTFEEELVRIKSEFITMVSHELRTPLSNIGSAAELLVKADLDQPLQKDMLQTLSREASRLMRLVDEVLEASRLDTGQVKLTLEPLALIPLIKQLLCVYESQYSNYRFNLKAGADPLFALGDRVSVEVVLENLLHNAINYSPTGSTITISVEERGQHARIQVADQGVGIPNDQLQGLFQRFHRLPDGTSRRPSGFGLGLYIARMLVEAQGGVILAESELGKGSSFSFTLKKLEDHDEEEDSDY